MNSSLPSLKEHLQQHSIRADKRFGQHFLLDTNITDKIVRLAGDLNGVHVVEIGPGPGGLTRSLMQSSAASVYAVEMDKRLFSLLGELADVSLIPLTIIEGDALKLSLPDAVPAPRAVIANLPYNVGTAMLIQWLKEISENPEAYQSLTLMFQKEVVERIAAQHASKHYGRLSILSQWLCEVHPLFDLPARAFSPPPKVDSGVVRLIPRKERADVKIENLEKLTGAAFGQRRKMLRSSLKSIVPDTEEWLLAHHITPTARAEELSVEEFIRLAQSL